jgi:hypothetical protein
MYREKLKMLLLPFPSVTLVALPDLDNNTRLAESVRGI